MTQGKKVRKQKGDGEMMKGEDGVAGRELERK